MEIAHSLLVEVQQIFSQRSYQDFFYDPEEKCGQSLRSFTMPALNVPKSLCYKAFHPTGRVFLANSSS